MLYFISKKGSQRDTSDDEEGDWTGKEWPQVWVMGSASVMNDAYGIPGEEWKEVKKKK